MENGSGRLLKGHEDRINEIRDIAKGYALKNTYNQYDFGLIYHLCQNRSNLSTKEIRSHVRGTTLQNAKQRIMVSFDLNTDGSHKLPISYIGTAAKPMFFENHDDVSRNYSHQRSTSMDGHNSQIWLPW